MPIKKKKIEVLGFSFVAQNKNLTKEIINLVEDHGMANLTEVEQSVDTLEFAKHGVVLAPAVIIDGKRKSVGRVPKKEEIQKWLHDLEDSIKQAEDVLEEMTDREYVKELRAGELDLIREDEYIDL